MTKSADIIARRLYEAGARHAYGIPGGEVLTLINSLEQSGINFHLVKHENSAGFMADGTFYATGVPGIVIATVGPGMANAVNAVANARLDRVPLIFISGSIDAHEAESYTHQVFEQSALMRPITKASFTMVDGAIDVIIDKAISIALDDPAGPVHIDLPISVADLEQVDSKPVRRGQVNRGCASGTDLEKARLWLTQAQQPLVICGVDALNQRAEETVAAFVRRFQIPLITTYKAKGVLSEDHPLCLGAAGLSPKVDENLLPLVQKCDLLILAGYDPIEMRSNWRNSWSDDSRVIEFSGTANTHYMHHSKLNFVGDVGAGLNALAEGIEQEYWSHDQLADIRKRLTFSFKSEENWGPLSMIRTARKILPADCVATVDTGAHRILLSQVWQCYEPRTLLQSTGLCTMGYALPSAIGYKRAQPQRTVVAFSGDAGLEMVLGELASVRDLGMPILIIVFVDQSLALIELKQRGRGLANLGVDFLSTDFVEIGRAYGMHAAWVDDNEILEMEINDGLKRETSTLLACRFKRQAYDGLF